MIELRWIRPADVVEHVAVHNKVMTRLVGVHAAEPEAAGGRAIGDKFYSIASNCDVMGGIVTVDAFLEASRDDKSLDDDVGALKRSM